MSIQPSVQMIIEELTQPKLSLELLCASAQSEPDDLTYFDPSEYLVHPKQSEVETWAREKKIGVHVAPTIDGDETYSDAYLYFDPKQIQMVADALKKIGWPGDILDIKGKLTAEEDSMIRKVAQAQGWKVEG